MGIPRDDDERAEVSLSPLIDCVFLLLIFFLVSTMTRKEQRDIDIVLPESVSAEKQLPRDEHLVIGLDREGAVCRDGQQTSLNQLHAELREIALRNPDQVIRLDADQATPVHKVVEILDLCQFNALSNVGIRTYDEHYNR
ncbi:MAG TPA: biopolymer transporter ExbD [Lentisphaeria bacterium]|nr:biopolymer transporter ExbD [Lentisphaeria bacterium]